jgi:hypothetical protein
MYKLFLDVDTNWLIGGEWSLYSRGRSSGSHWIGGLVGPGDEKGDMEK